MAGRLYAAIIWNHLSFGGSGAQDYRRFFDRPVDSTFVLQSRLDRTKRTTHLTLADFFGEE